VFASEEDGLKTGGRRQVGVLRRPAGSERHLTDDRAIKPETRNGSRDERKEGQGR
jgi:hypothetical protein